MGLVVVVVQRGSPLILAFEEGYCPSSLFKISIPLLEEVMYKLIFERFPISLSEMNSMGYGEFQEMVEKMVEFSVDLKNRLNKNNI